MKKLVPLIASLFLSVTVSAADVGDQAPDFELPASDGNTYRLSDYRGDRAVVIAWYPKAFTSGCTVECKSLAENGHLIEEFDVAYFMASVDPLADNTAFAEENNAQFPILSDEDKRVAEAFDVLIPVIGVASRTTIYIDKDGVIAFIDDDINPATSAEDIASRLDALGVARL